MTLTQKYRANFCSIRFEGGHLSEDANLFFFRVQSVTGFSFMWLLKNILVVILNQYVRVFLGCFEKKICLHEWEKPVWGWGWEGGRLWLERRAASKQRLSKLSSRLFNLPHRPFARSNRGWLHESPKLERESEKEKNLLPPFFSREF